MTLKIVHITPSFYPATYWGGPIFSVYGLCNALPKSGEVDLRVLTTDSAGPRLGDSLEVKDFPVSEPAGYEVYFCRRWWGATFAPGLILRLWPMIRWADVVQLTAVYSSPTIPTLLLCRLLGKPVIWSPIGTLQRWKGTTKPLLKAIWERICNALIKPGRCVLHVTSTQEAEESLARLPKAHTELIVNGVDCPEGLPARQWRPGGTLRLLFIGRLHPKKGIENLLLALRELADDSITLTVCGTGDAQYVSQLSRLPAELGLTRTVNFRGHVEGDGRTLVFQEADVCIVPSFTENFGMVVVEALAHAVPVIVAKGAPWAQIEEKDCGLWVDNDPTSLARAIRRIRDLDLAAMGERGKAWMRADFSWETAARKMLQIHYRLSGRNIDGR